MNPLGNPIMSTAETRSDSAVTFDLKKMGFVQDMDNFAGMESLGNTTFPFLINVK